MPAAPPTHSVYAIVGSDRFLRGLALDELLGALGSDMDALGPVRMDGPSADLADILDDVRTPSLLGGRRVVVLDDADECITANRARFEKYCAEPAVENCLVFLCDSMPKTTKLHKIIAEKGQVIACEALKGRAINAWVARRAKDVYGKRVSEAVAQVLRDHVGDALGSLDTELGKLASFVGERGEITVADIRAATGESREEKVFTVMDAMAAGETGVALRHWQQVLATDRAAPAKAVGGLAYAVRRLIEARSEWEKGQDLSSIARRMFTDPAVLKRRLEQNPLPRLRRQQGDLLALDVAVKTGASTVDVAVEKFIVTHSAA